MVLTRVYLEVGAKRTFAMALDWPGWGRSGRTADEALEALADYVARYAPVAKKAGLTVDATFDVGTGGETHQAVDEVGKLLRKDPELVDDDHHARQPR